MEREPYRLYELRRDTPRKSGIAYEESLNAAQLEAVMATDGPLLVIAGAGTGKTRTLTYRVARLVENGIDPDRIALLTFTRRAAQEMIGRVQGLVGSDVTALAGGTFHGFSAAMLRRHPPEGYPSRFTILDRGDAEDTIQVVRGERGIVRGERRFPRKRTLYDIFSKSVNQSRAIDEVVQSEYETFASHVEAILEIQRAYATFKRNHALVDYDDLLVLLVDALRTEGPARTSMCARFLHVLVDEYQDTNRLQADIADLLVERHGNIAVVGDDSQSIYAFRGADYRNILEFPSRYPNARLVKLEENYRSTQEILDVTNAIIGAATIGFPKRLRTSRKDGAKPAVVMTRSDADQAAFIVQRILELREEGVQLQENAVLFRSSFLSYELELELARRDIPFVKYGGFRFLEAAHVKDVIAHLRVVANARDRVAWTRLLCLLPGIGPKRAQGIFESAAAAGQPYVLKPFAMPGPARAHLLGLEALFSDLTAGEAAPAERVARVLTYAEPLLRDRYDDPDRRLRDLEHFQVLTEGYATLESLLSDLSLDPPDRAVENTLSSALDEGERLVLSTIHSAKGMEWRNVFLLGALDGYFPSFTSARTTESLEEERRLMYVATTRARERLYVTYPVGLYHPGTGRVLTEASRFLQDVPEGLFERWAVTG